MLELYQNLIVFCFIIFISFGISYFIQEKLSFKAEDISGNIDEDSNNENASSNTVIVHDNSVTDNTSAALQTFSDIADMFTLSLDQISYQNNGNKAAKIILAILGGAIGIGIIVYYIS